MVWKQWNILIDTKCNREQSKYQTSIRATKNKIKYEISDLRKSVTQEIQDLKADI